MKVFAPVGGLPRGLGQRATRIPEGREGREQPGCVGGVPGGEVWGLLTRPRAWLATQAGSLRRLGSSYPARVHVCGRVSSDLR